MSECVNLVISLIGGRTYKAILRVFEVLVLLLRASAHARCGATKHDLDMVVGIHPTSAEEFTTMDITKRSGLSAARSGC